MHGLFHKLHFGYLERIQQIKKLNRFKIPCYAVKCKTSVKIM